MSDITRRIRFILTGETRQMERQFGRGAQTITRSNQQIERSMRQVQRTALRMAGVIAGLAGAAGFTSLIRQQAQFADELEKTRIRTGVAVESLSTLDFAARQNGTSLEALTRGFRNLSTRMDEAVRGSGAGAELFNRLGIDVQNANGEMRELDAVLLDVADRFADLNNEGQRLALAQQLFGQRGEELIPLLSQGSEEIERLQQRARDLGLEISGNVAREAADLNDNLDELRGAVQGLARSIMSQAVPAMNELVRVFRAGKEEAGTFTGILDAVGTAGGANLSRRLENVRKNIELTEEALRHLREDPSWAQENVPGLADRNEQRLLRQLESQREQYDALLSRIEARNQLEQDTRTILDARRGLEEGAGKGAEQRSVRERQINDSIREQNRLLTAAQQRLEAAKNEAKELAEVFEGLRGAEARGGAPETILDVMQLRAEADRALRAGDADEAIRQAREAARIIGDLQENDDLINASAATIRAIEEIATGAAKAREAQAQQEITNIEAEIGRLQEELSGLSLEGKFDDAELKTETARARELIEKEFEDNPVQVPVIHKLTQPGRQPSVQGIPGYASGGSVRGPGGPRDDSILARLSAGEYVVPTRAVQHYGTAFLDQLRTLRLPRFADGGLVGTSQLQQSHSGAPVHLHIGDRTFQLEAKTGDMASDLRRVVARQALKTGRRGR